MIKGHTKEEDAPANEDNQHRLRGKTGKGIAHLDVKLLITAVVVRYSSARPKIAAIPSTSRVKSTAGEMESVALTDTRIEIGAY